MGTLNLRVSLYPYMPKEKTEGGGFLCGRAVWSSSSSSVGRIWGTYDHAHDAQPWVLTASLLSDPGTDSPRETSREIKKVTLLNRVCI